MYAPYKVQPLSMAAVGDVAGYLKEKQKKGINVLN